MTIERWRPFGSIERWDPFRNISDIQGEVNRLFGRFSGRPTAVATGSGVRMWAPVLDMHATKDDLVLNFELPGVREKEVSLSITGDLLTVPRPQGRELPSRRACPWEVRAECPASDACPGREGEGQYRDGVLEVKLPKVDEVKPKDIKIDNV